MKIVWYGLLNYFTPHLIDILEKNWLYINAAKNRKGISPDNFHQALTWHVEHNEFLS